MCVIKSIASIQFFTLEWVKRPSGGGGETNLITMYFSINVPLHKEFGDLASMCDAKCIIFNLQRETDWGVCGGNTCDCQENKSQVPKTTLLANVILNIC